MPVDKFKKVYILGRKADSWPPDAPAAAGTPGMCPVGRRANMQSHK